MTNANVPTFVNLFDNSWSSFLGQNEELTAYGLDDPQNQLNQFTDITHIKNYHQNSLATLVTRSVTIIWKLCRPFTTFVDATIYLHSLIWSANRNYETQAEVGGVNHDPRNMTKLFIRADEESITRTEAKIQNDDAVSDIKSKTIGARVKHPGGIGCTTGHGQCETEGCTKFAKQNKLGKKK